MAILNEIANYQNVQWHNYLPPSIDQDNLNHLEENIKLNRDTINEIIRNLGIAPNGASVEDQNIYNNPIYTTLISFKNRLKKLESDKLNISDYSKNLGDISQLQGGTNLVEAINNRLRRDIDDSSNHTYTFKKLVLNNTNAEALNVTGSATISRNLVVAGISSSGKVTVTHTDGIETTKLKVSKDATFGDSVTVTKLLTANGGIQVNGNETITDTLTVAHLVVTDSLICNGTTTTNAITANGDITSTEHITASKDIRASGTLCCLADHIQMRWGDQLPHTLYVHGGNQTLGDGDAFIQTVR